MLDYSLYPFMYLRQRNAEVDEDISSNSGTFLNEADEQVFGTDVFVVEAWASWFARCKILRARSEKRSYIGSLQSNHRCLRSYFGDQELILNIVERRAAFGGPSNRNPRQRFANCCI